MFASLRRRWARVGRLPRLSAAGVCLLLALTSAVDAQRASGAATAPVVVAARELSAGLRLTAADLRVVRLPAALRPAGARADPASVVGRRLAGPMSAREPVTGARLLGRELAAGLPPGRVAATVTVDDPHTADLVHAGDRVDLLSMSRAAEGTAAPTGGAVSTLARAAPVLASYTRSDDVTGASAELVIAVDRAVAVEISREHAFRMFTVFVDPP